MSNPYTKDKLGDRIIINGRHYAPLTMHRVGTDWDGFSNVGSEGWKPSADERAEWKVDFESI